MTYETFLETLALTRNKWEWMVLDFDRLRCRTDTGRHQCPITAVAAFQGVGEWVTTEAGQAIRALGLGFDGVDIVMAADGVAGGQRPGVRADLLRAVGLGI